MAKMKPEEFFAHESVEEYCTKPVFDQDGVQVSAGIGPDGLEYGDPVPMAPPIGYDSPPDLMHMIRSMIRNERFMQGLDEAGVETFEEADDFELDDDPLDPLTPYERVFDPADTPPPGQPPKSPSEAPLAPVTAPESQKPAAPPAPSVPPPASPAQSST